MSDLDWSEVKEELEYRKAFLQMITDSYKETLCMDKWLIGILMPITIMTAVLGVVYATQGRIWWIILETVLTTVNVGNCVSTVKRMVRIKRRIVANEEDIDRINFDLELLEE